MPVQFANHDRPRDLRGGADVWDDGPASLIILKDYFEEASSLVSIYGVARGGASSAAAFVKRGTGTGTGTGAGSNAATSTKNSTGSGTARGGSSNLGTGLKRVTGSGTNAAAGSVSSIGFRRLPASAAVATGGQTTAQAPKRTTSVGVLSGAGFLIALSSKVTGATAIAGRSAGGSFVIATGVRRVLSTSVVRSGGATQQTSTKRATTAGTSQGASRTGAQGSKRAVSFAVSFAAGRTTSLSARFSNFAAKVATGAATTSQSVKRVAGSGNVTGGGGVLISFTPPPLPDVVNIAGRWLVSVGITGVVPGDVVVAGQREDIELNATLDDAAEITGRDSSPVLIKGTRKQA